MEAAFLILAATCGVAEQNPSGHGEKLGSANFRISCNEVAQSEFNRAVALLHSFQFSRAIEGFDAVLARDATCGIAYWGISLSNWGNPFAPGLKEKGQLQLGREGALRGKIVGATTERELAYLAAVGKLYSDYENTPQRMRMVAYRDAMGEVAARYPEDSEAQIFYALALVASEDAADKAYAGRIKAGAILEKLFDREPTHPGIAHYIIHTYDVPALAGQALVAARRYAEIAPDAPHALHMPSHVFTRLGYWQESIDSNVAAASAARREGQTAEELHASDYEIYAYLQTAQDAQAGLIVHSLLEVESRFDPNAALEGAGGPSVGYFALAAIPARYAIERQDWGRAQELALRETPFPYADAMTWFARGLGAARLGHTAAANHATVALHQIKQRLLQSSEFYWARQVEIQELGVSAWADFSAGSKHKAMRQMKSAVELEERTEKSAVTPGPLAPARELLAEMLLQMDEPKRALEQYQATLQSEPRRFRSLYGAGRAAQLNGNRSLSQKYFRELLKVCVPIDRLGRSEIEKARQAILAN